MHDTCADSTLWPDHEGLPPRDRTPPINASHRMPRFYIRSQTLSPEACLPNSTPFPLHLHTRIESVYHQAIGSLSSWTRSTRSLLLSQPFHIGGMLPHLKNFEECANSLGGEKTPTISILSRDRRLAQTFESQWFAPSIKSLVKV
jgi:hypothetical protein